jgi:hypothetical protein
MTLKTRPKSLEAWLIMHSRFRLISLLIMVVKPFASVSIIGKPATSPFTHTS